MISNIQKLTRRRNGKQTTVYRAFYKSRNTDKRISRTFPLKSDARQWLQQLTADQDLAASLAHGDSVRLFSDLCDAHMAQFQGKDTSHHLRVAFWRKQLGSLKLKDITPDRVRRILRTYEGGTAKRGKRGKNGQHKAVVIKGRPRSAASVNRMKACLGSLQKFARDEYGLKTDWLATAPHRTENRGRIRFLDDTERKALLDACEASDWPRLKLVVLMALFTGARRSELLGLRWSDIDMSARTATLHDTKNGEPRMLVMPAPVIQELMKFREVGNGHVFPSWGRPRKDGKPRKDNPDRPYEFRPHWGKAVQDAGLDNFRFHDLRHTCASYLAKNGATLLMIGQVLGHKSTQTTLRYAHLVVSDKQAAVDAMAAAIDAGGA